MENIDVFDVVIGRNTYDVISANTAFYAFIGSRMFRTFDQLLAEEDAARLEEYLESGQNLLLNLVSESGESRQYLALQEAQDETVSMRLLPFDKIHIWGKQMRYSADRKRCILEMVNGYYFEYTVKTDRMRVYNINIVEEDLFLGSLAEFEEMLCGNIGGEHSDEIERLIVSLRTGERRFSQNIDGNVLKVENARFALVKGMSYYENQRYEFAAGYIRVWNEETRNVKRELERDYLTGVLTKAEITNLAIHTIDVKKQNNVTMAIIDIDFFKKVNDVYGHMTGDEVLREVAAIIENEVKNSGVVGRFGGDEFLVLFYDAYDMENMRERLRSIRSMVSSAFARKENGRGMEITLSIGCAAYPKDADSYEDVFLLADFALYLAKGKGRNRYIIYNESLHGSLKKIKEERTLTNTADGRNSLTPAETVCAMMNRFYAGAGYPLQELLDDISLNFNVQRVMLYAGQPYELVQMAGQRRLSAAVIKETKDYLDDPSFAELYDPSGMLVMDNILRLEKPNPVVYDKLHRQGVISFVHIKFADKNGNQAVLCMEAVKKAMTWNPSLMSYYSLLARLLEHYELI